MRRNIFLKKLLYNILKLNIFKIIKKIFAKLSDINFGIKIYKETEDMTLLFAVVSYNVNNSVYANANPLAPFVASFWHDANYSNSN